MNAVTLGAIVAFLCSGLWAQAPLRQTPAETPQKEAVSGAAQPKPAQPDDQARQQRPSSSDASHGQVPAQSVIPPAPRRTRPIGPDERVIQFQFVAAPWDQVLRWFAEVSGLALQMESKPTGTFSYIRDPNKYTLAEAMDILNEALIPQGYYLVRKGNFLKVISTEEGIPADLIPRVSVEELDKRGAAEFISVILPVEGVDAEEAAKEIEYLKSEYGRVTALKSINALLVTDQAQHARAIRDFLKELATGEHSVQVKFRAFQLKYASARTVEAIVRDLLGLPPRQASSTATASQRRRDPREEFRERMRRFFASRFGRGDGGPPMPPGPQQPPQPQAAPQQPQGVATSVDEYTNTLFVAAPPEKLAQVAQVVEMVDVPREQLSEEVQTPQMRVYRLADGDASSLVEALRVIYENNPSVRFSADETNNAVVAIAPPAEQARIRQLVEEFERGEREVAVIQLTQLDASAVAELLDELYSSGQRDFRGRPIIRPGQPRIQADTARNRLVVRASKAQIEDIRRVLASLGEYHALATSGSDQRIRVLPTPGLDVRELAEQLRRVWRRPNPIKVIMPAERRRPRLGAPQAVPPDEERRPPTTQPNGEGSDRQLPDAARHQTAPRFHFAAYQGERSQRQPSGRDAATATQQDNRTKTPPVPKSAPEQQSADSQGSTQQPQTQAPSVVIYPGPNGIVIASDDPAALEEAYQVLQALTQQAAGPQFVVVPLRYADATQVAETLRELLTDTEQRPVFPFFFFGFREEEEPRLRIVAETRTNSIILTGSMTEVERARQLIEQVLDRPDLPLDSATARPRIIPVSYGDAEEIAQVIRDVYGQYMAAGRTSPQPSGPRFGFFGFFGSRSSRSSRGGTPRQQLAIGVDPTSNSIIVSCPEPLFEEIEQLVRTLDQAALASQQQEVVRVIAVRNATPSQIKEALLGLQGLSEERRQRSREERERREREERERGEGDRDRPPFTRSRRGFFRR